MGQVEFNALIERAYRLSPSTTDDVLESALKYGYTLEKTVALLRSIVADYAFLGYRLR